MVRLIACVLSCRRALRNRDADMLRESVVAMDIEKVSGCDDTNFRCVHQTLHVCNTRPA